VAFSNLTRSVTPAAAARCFAVSTDSAWKSKPVNRDFGYAFAMMIVDAP